MAKKNRGKKVTSKRLTSNPEPASTGIEYYPVESPFKGMSESKAIEAMKKVGEEFGRQFPESFQKLQELLLRFDPIRLLSFLAYHFLIKFVGRDTDLATEAPVSQHHFELVLSLALQHKKEDFGSEPILGSPFWEFLELLQQTTKAFSIRRYSSLQSATSKEDYKRLRTLEYIRTDTQVLRNWGYPEQITRIAKQLFSPLEDSVKQKAGIRLSDLIDMCSRIADVIEDRASKHLDLLRPILRAKSVSSAIQEYYKEASEFELPRDEFYQLIREKNISLKELKDLLFKLSTFRLPDIFTFSTTDFIEAYPAEITKDVLQPVLNRWAYSFGDLAGQDPEHFFMGNPIWQRPFIQMETDKYLCPIIGIFLSFCIELMEAVIRENAELYDKYEKRRGEFLEEEVERLFRSAFPSARIYRGSLWRDPDSNTQYENDILVLVDSYLIIVEAKSGRVTQPARRGGERRLQHTINELLIKASKQAKGLADYLRENAGIHKFETRRGVINEVDTTGVNEIICLNVTLESLGALASRWPDLRAAGFVPEDVELSPTLSLAELENVFHILPSTCQKLHYLVRRAQLEVNTEYLADEMDLLAFYLDTSFNIGEAEFDHTGLMLYGMSNSLHPYFMSQQSKQRVPKPRIRLTKYWENLLRYVEERGFPRWTELGIILLNVDYETQLEFETGFRKVRKNVQSQWQTRGHNNVYISISGPPQRQDVLVGLGYKRVSVEDRNRMMDNASAEAFERTSANRALVIGVDVEQRGRPYSVVACFNRRQE